MASSAGHPVSSSATGFIKGNVPCPVGADHRVADAGQGDAEPPLLLHQARLRLLAAGDVPHDGQEPFGVADRGALQVHLHPEEAPLAVAGQPLEELGLAGRGLPYPRQGLLLGVRRRACGKIPHREAARLVRGVPVHLGHFRVDVQDLPGFRVVYKDGVVDRLEDGAVVGLGETQRLLLLLELGNVDKGGQGALCFRDEGDGHPDIPGLALAVDQPELVLVRGGGGLREAGLAVSKHARQVRGGHKLGPLSSALDLLAREAGKPRELLVAEGDDVVLFDDAHRRPGVLKDGAVEDVGREGAGSGFTVAPHEASPHWAGLRGHW